MYGSGLKVILSLIPQAPHTTRYPNYPLNYDGKYLHCYNIKNRKKTYRKYGNSRAWKEYIKTIEKTIE